MHSAPSGASGSLYNKHLIWEEGRVPQLHTCSAFASVGFMWPSELSYNKSIRQKAVSTTVRKVVQYTQDYFYDRTFWNADCKVSKLEHHQTNSSGCGAGEPISFDLFIPKCYICSSEGGRHRAWHHQPHGWNMLDWGSEASCSFQRIPWFFVKSYFVLVIKSKAWK